MSLPLAANQLAFPFKEGVANNKPKQAIKRSKTNAASHPVAKLNQGKWIKLYPSGYSQLNIHNRHEQYVDKWSASGVVHNGFLYLETPNHKERQQSFLPTIVASEHKGAARNRFVGSPKYRGSKMAEGLRVSHSDPIYTHPAFAEACMGFPMDWTNLQSGQVFNQTSNVNLPTKKFISLFSGIGGFDIGLESAGMSCVAQVEINGFARSILNRRWPDVPKFEDVHHVDRHNLPSADLICGGFPCQPHSNTGKRLGSQDHRDLWCEFSRVIDELRPKWVIAENVPGILSSESNQYFANLLRDLVNLGYDIEWRVVEARAFGAPHKRSRVVIVARTNNETLMNRQHIFTHRAEKHTFFSWLEGVNSLEGLRKKTDFYPSLLIDGKQKIPNQVQRLTSLGNAILPQMAEYIGRSINRQIKI